MAAEPHPLPTLADLQSAIEDALPAQLPSASPIAQPLADAMRYAVLGGGKRLRAMLACAACLSLGGRLEDALAPACALECMHAYSLVHDDLPDMDDDALRRGRPSCHIAYGVATAILAGDALQALAFEILAKAPKASAEVRLAAVRVLGSACGWSGMAGGQAFDIASEGERLSLPQLQALHAAKTGALVQAAVEIGALFGGADEQALAQLRTFGSRIGLAFQIIDDVLDLTQSSDTLGKPAGSDQRAGKSTFALLMGVQPARAHAQQLLDEALALLAKAPLRGDLLAQLGRQAVHRQH